MYYQYFASNGLEYSSFSCSKLLHRFAFIVFYAYIVSLFTYITLETRRKLKLEGLGTSKIIVKTLRDKSKVKT